MNESNARRLAAASSAFFLASTAALAQRSETTHLESDAALNALLPAAACVAEARIGDLAQGPQYELLLGAPLQKPAAKAGKGWTSGALVPFRLAYDGFGYFTFEVGGKLLGFETKAPIEVLALRGYARRAGTRVEAQDLLLNLVPLGTTVDAVPAGGVPGLDVLLAHGSSLATGFVLRGKLAFHWKGAAPKGSDLSLRLFAGELADMARDYCTAGLNSLSQRCDLYWSGTTSISAANLVLRARGGIPGSAVMFLAGGSMQSVPFGNGLLCVGAPLERFDPPLGFDSTGSTSQAIDYAVPPLGTGPLAVLPGDTRYFQLWYRDPQGVPDVYNLSDALSLTFVP